MASRSYHSRAPRAAPRCEETTTGDIRNVGDNWALHLSFCGMKEKHIPVSSVISM